MAKPEKIRPCRHCGGSGIEPDRKKIGEEMRSLRERSGLSLRAMRAKVGFSVSFLSDCELGNRNFTSELIEAYKKAVRG